MSTKQESTAAGQGQCGQKDCSEVATYRYTWPGKDEDFACDKHAQAIQTIGMYTGCYIQLIPLATTRTATAGE